MVSRVKKVLALVSAIIVCAALCPAVAHAAQLATGTAPAADSPKTAVHTQATKPVYMITKITKTRNDSDGYTEKTESKFAYNKSMLVKSCNGQFLKWSYGKNNGIKSIVRDGGMSSLVYRLNAKGRQISCLDEGDFSAYTSKPKYNKAGRIVSMKTEYYYYEDDELTIWKTPYSYRNGLRVREGDKRFTYDKRKNLLKYADDDGSFTFKNTYRNGRLVKRTYTRSVGDVTRSVTFKYSYKRVNVQKSLFKKVKAQQWALVNNNLNDALGCAATLNSLLYNGFGWD